MHRKGIGPSVRCIAVDDTCVAAERCIEVVAAEDVSETAGLATGVETAGEQQHAVDVKGVGTVGQSFWLTLL